MLQDLNARPWMLMKHARVLAELHTSVHRKSIAGLPTYKDRLRDDIRETSQLTDNLREKALVMLGRLPDGESVCHGDYHPGNIFLTKNGPVVIDWMTACSGSPRADISAYQPDPWHWHQGRNETGEPVHPPGHQSLSSRLSESLPRRSSLIQQMNCPAGCPSLQRRG